MLQVIYDKNKLINTHFWAKLILLLFIIVQAFHFQHYRIQAGLTPSWQFALNYFANEGIIFGRDVAFTYGPLGFLMVPMAIGNNLLYAAIFQLFIWVIFASLFGYLLFNDFIELKGLFLFAVLFSFGSINFDAEHSLKFYILFFIFAAYTMDRWYYPLCVAIFLSCLSFYIKFNIGMSALLTLTAFCFLSFFSDNSGRANKVTIITLLSVPLLLVTGYMTYNPSIRDFLSYLSCNYQFMIGYSIAMSTPGQSQILILAFFIILIFSYILYLLFKYQKNLFILSLCLLPETFLSFKRAFVRYDGAHTPYFFSFMLLLIGLILLFSKLSKNNIYNFIIISVLPLFVWGIFMVFGHHRYLNMDSRLSSYYAINNLKADIFNLSKFSFSNNLTTNLLPQNILINIGKRSVGVFPWEISYIHANALDYSPFPIFQTYAAYTAYLDSLNAHFLENSKIAPALILMEWKSIDNRHPLIDVPAMWLSIYRWYDIRESTDCLLVLGRRKLPRFNHLELISKKEYKLGETINIPESNSPIIVKITMKLNWKGLLSKIFYKVPAIIMSVGTNNGDYSLNRVVPETLNNNLMIDPLPSNIRDLKELFQNVAVSRKSSFVLAGPGKKMFGDNISIEFYNIPNLTINHHLNK